MPANSVERVVKLATPALHVDDTALHTIDALRPLRCSAAKLVGLPSMSTPRQPWHFSSMSVFEFATPL